jgi:cytochrome c peroxidase
MSHILRVFLIDESRRIRNIYSTSFLHADTVANDVRSLLIEAQAHSNTTTEPGH